MNAITLTLIAQATTEQLAKLTIGQNKLREEFQRLSHTELGCAGDCRNCQWINICDK